jgi:hypothetical protein
MKRVIRPGPLQYGYMLFVPALFIIGGIATIVAGFVTESPGWATLLPVGIVIAAPGIAWAAYFVGMTVEVDATQVSKLYLFGWMRETIPFARLAADVSRESDQYGNDIKYVNFSTIDGRGAFTLLSGWVWRGRDVDALFRKASYVDAPMRRQNRILSVVAIGLPLMGVGIVVTGFGILIAHALFHWPS